MPTGAPQAPADLSADERTVWDRLADVLGAMKVATRADEVALAGLSQFYALYLSLMAESRKAGAIVSTHGQDVPNPHLSLALKVWDKVMKLAVEFGLTPSARSRIKTDDGTPEDPLGDLLGEIASGN